jgi:ABC-type glycerol-3-phosphate transport system substrate-binding protein
MQIYLSQRAPTYDIMATDAFLPTFAERGWLMPLDPLIAKLRQAVDWDDIDPTLVRDVCSYKGKVYGVPNLAISMFFFYRKDLFDAAGLKPPATMDEWIAAARTLTKADKKQYGTAMTLKAGDGFQNDFTYYLRTFGGDWYDKDWKVTIDSEAGVKALTTMKELMKYAPPNVLAFHNDESTVAMQQGLTAMGSSGSRGHWPWTTPRSPRSWTRCTSPCPRRRRREARATRAWPWAATRSAPSRRTTPSSSSR